jgi:lysophospholipase L1-like esterase
LNAEDRNNLAMQNAILLNLLFLSATFVSCGQTISKPPMTENVIRYVALGDSYTICEGASAAESWPVILSTHLCEKGVQTKLVANPSRTGWTTQNLIDRELSIFDTSKADFVTLLIGVNDWVQGVSKAVFEKNLKYILDHVQSGLKDKSRLVLINIPDFSVVPAAAYFNDGRDISKGIAEFNAVIREEAEKRKLKLVDLFPLSQQMKGKPELVAKDGLHPSAKEYALWEALILPVADAVLRK